jgi:heme o synthase
MSFAPVQALAQSHARPSDFVELAKLRITLLASTAAVCAAHVSGAATGRWHLLGVAAATFALSAGACALNQLIERDRDALMLRTSNRPIPAGRLSPRHALLFGAALVTVGATGFLALGGMPAALLAAAAALFYLGIYTPLKTRTPHCTLPGAVAGAMPVMLGWAAASATFDARAFTLFLLMCAWQVPHFLAIAWMYRDDFARGGFPWLAVMDPTGRRTARQMLLFASATGALSLAPAIIGFAGSTYLVAAVVAGIIGVLLATRFAFAPTRKSARGVFLFSLAHLPILLALLVW